MRMNVANPLSLRRGGLVSPAQAIWGATFELWGPDCPLGPGDWVDRIGGIACPTYGAGNWITRAAPSGDLAAGVSRSDVCYVGLPEAAGAQLLPNAGGDYKEWTFVCVYSCSHAITGTVIVPFFNVPYIRSGAPADQAKMLYRDIDGVLYYHATIGTPGDPNFSQPKTLIGSSDFTVMAWGSGIGTATSQGGYGFNDFADTDWNVMLGMYGGTALNGEGDLFRKHSTSTIGNTVTRDMVILSLAAGPGLVPVALLQQWVATMGVVWP